MPTDLSLSREITREQLDRYRHPGMHFSDKGGLEVTVARGMFEHLLRVAEAHLAEPARIAAARQEGYREGVADAKQAAGFAAWRHEGDDARSRGMDAGARHQVAECVKAIAALSPPPAEPSDGWIEWKGGECPIAHGATLLLRFRDGSTKSTILHRTYRWQHKGQPDDIVAYRIVKLAEPSDEEWLRGLIAWCRPGVVRDALDRYLAEGTAVPDMTPIVQSAEPSAPVAPDWPTRCAALEADGIAARKRVAALETENAKLREGLKDTTAHLVAAHSLLSRTPRAKKAAPSNTMFDMMLRDYEASCERARALLQGGPDAG